MNNEKNNRPNFPIALLIGFVFAIIIAINMSCNSSRANTLRGPKPTITNNLFLESSKAEECGAKLTETFPAITRIVIFDNTVIAIGLDRWSNNPNKAIKITSPEAFRDTYTGDGRPVGIILATVHAKTLRVNMSFSVRIKTDTGELVETVLLELWPSAEGFTGRETIQSTLIEKNQTTQTCFSNHVIFGVE